MKRRPGNYPINFKYDRSVTDLRAKRVTLKPTGIAGLIDLRKKMQAAGWIK